MLVEIITSAQFFCIIIVFYLCAVLGFMSGSNRSGDLSDAQKSIPVGTIGAVIFTSIICIFLAFIVIVITRWCSVSWPQVVDSARKRA